MSDHINNLEKEAEKKAQKRKKKRTRKPKMKVSGKDVFKIQKLRTKN